MPIDSIEDRETCDRTLSQVAQPLPRGVSAGARVFVRGRPWRVEAILAHADCRELHLARSDHAARCVILWPFDRPSAADDMGRPRFTSVRLKTWTAALRDAVSGDVDPLTPRGSASAAILPYQLAPAIAMIAGAPRVLL